MSKIIKDLVEYNGIDNYQCQILNFKTISISYNHYIKEENPNIDKVVKVWANANIINKYVVNTPVGESLEGQISTGKKLLVCGDVNLRVEYLPESLECKNQSLYTTNIIFPFSTYIVLPDNISEHTIVTSNVLVEDISTIKSNKRCLYSNITLMAIADVY